MSAMAHRQIALAHAALALAAAVGAVRALHQPWVRQAIPDERALFAFVVALPLLSALASVLAIALGLRTGTPLRALLTDLAGAIAVVAVAFPLAFGTLARDVVGIFYVALVAIRLAPSALLVLDGRERSALAVFALSALWYGAVATWSFAATAAQGDQPHYLLVADRLARASLDPAPAYADPALFRELSGLDLTPEDLETHVVDTPAGPRPVQGYAIALLVAPGWALAGRLGALLVLALVAAFASAQTYLLCRETARDDRLAAIAWALVALAAPVVTLAAVIFPNVVGAAAIVLAYRWLFTAARRRPFLAGLAAAVTLFLTPRDLVAVVFLAPFAIVAGRNVALRFGGALALGALAAGALNLALYGLPVPYAGYAFGIGAAQRFLGQPTLSFEVWRALPGMLFDRAFGIAGSAPWVFVGVAGILPALRWERPAPTRPRPATGSEAREAESARARGSPGAARLAPGLAAVLGSVAALSIYRLWEGGWAPPNRYLVDVLPLWAPFVAYGIGALRVAITAVLAALGGVATFFFAAIPNLAYNALGEARLVEALDQVLVVDPFGWLPSFEVPDLVALAVAWLRAIPLVAGVAALFWLGARERAVALPPMGRRGSVALFVLANAVAIAAVALLASPDGPGAREEPDFARSLVTRWLPFALGLATLLTAALAWLSAERRSLFLRHLALWLAVPATLAFARFGDALDERVLGLPFVVLVFGIAAHGIGALVESRAALSDRAIGLLLGATLLASSLALLPYVRTLQPPESDEPHYLLAMRSLVRDGDLDLKDEYDAREYGDFYPEELPDRHVIHVGPHQYPIHDLGLVFAGALPFALGGRNGVLALMCLAGAVFAWRGYAFLRDLGVARTAALAATAGVSFLHPLLTYTTQVYPELLGATAVLLVAELVARVSPARLSAASALVGTLPWLSARFWPVAAGLGLVIVWLALRELRARPRLAVALAAAAALPFALVVGAYAALDQALFGVPLPNAAYYGLRESTRSGLGQPILAFHPEVGVPGMLLDRTFGLLSRVPSYALAFFGLVPLLGRAWATRSAPLAALGLATLFSTPFVGSLSTWYADGGPSSRYLVVSLPLLLAAVAAALERVRGPVAISLVALVTLWSATVTFLFALAPDLRYDMAPQVAPTGGPGELWTFVTFALRATPGLAFPSVVRGAPQDWALVAVWGIVLVTLVTLGMRPLEAPREAARPKS